MMALSQFTCIILEVAEFTLPSTTTNRLSGEDVLKNTMIQVAKCYSTLQNSSKLCNRQQVMV